MQNTVLIPDDNWTTLNWTYNIMRWFYYSAAHYCMKYMSLHTVYCLHTMCTAQYAWSSEYFIVFVFLVQLRLSNESVLCCVISERWVVGKSRLSQEKKTAVLHRNAGYELFFQHLLRIVRQPLFKNTNETVNEMHLMLTCSVFLHRCVWPVHSGAVDHGSPWQSQNRR